MNKKIVIAIILCVIAAITISLWLSRANLLFHFVENKFLQLKSFTADSVRDGEIESKMFYKRPGNYKVIDKNGNLKFLFSNGVFYYATVENKMGKIDINVLNDAEKRMFYTQIPPFTGIFYLSIPGNPLFFKGTEMINGKAALHFFVQRFGGMGKLGINFWVDKNTGIIVKYIDQDGHDDNWSNIQVDKPVHHDEFLSDLGNKIQIEDVTARFKFKK